MGSILVFPCLVFCFALGYGYIHGANLDVGFILPAVIAVGTVVFGLALAKLSVFTLDRIARQYECKTTSIFGCSIRTVSFDGITGAEIQWKYGNDPSPSYRVVLQTSEGDLPLSLGYSSDQDECEKVCDAVNALLGKGACP